MTSSPSAIWDSRFSDDSGRAVALYSRRQGDQPVDVGDILAATKSQLPYIGPEQLQFHGVLGAGTSFKVNREVYTKPVTDPSSQVRPSPYFVAVKHMILSPRADGDQDAYKRRRLYSNVSREIRVLMHPPLRDHCCIIPVLAYGWTNHPSEGANPYLIVDYSDHGTLTRYLRRCRIPLHERRELAVDVAVGIKVLHDNKIIHGDVKPENILVFDSANDYSPRPQTAKLADFGSSLFEQDVENEASYLGTPFYNAPEIEGRPKYDSKKDQAQGAWCIGNGQPRMSQYKKADIYSFGLLLWEIVKNGVDIIEKPWLTDGESELDFLKRICETEKNGMLQRAHMFCEKLKGDGVRDSLLNPVKETFRLSLLDDASERADIEKIIESLSRGSDETRGPARYPLARISPPMGSYGPIPASAEHLQRAMPLPKQVSKARYIPIRYNPQPPKGGEVYALAPYVKEDAQPTNQNFIYKALDMFQVAVAMSPPWNVQADIVDKLKLDITYERDPVKHAEASLQFSICHHLGFGIEPNLVKSMQCLSDAVADNSIAQSIFFRVWQANESVVPKALDSVPSLTALDRKLHDLDQAEYFVRRIQAHQRAVGVRMASTSPLLSAATIGDDATIETLLSSGDISQALLSEAVLISCRYGRYGLLRSLLSKCHKYHGSTTEPTPLHWLVMFNEPDVSQLAEMLVNGGSGKSSRGSGICGELLGSMPKSVVSSPEHCMELFGSPLHWAVRVRHIPLVQALIKLGADVNLRWRAPRQLSSEPTTLHIPDYSPLDMAVAFHCPDVVDILLAAGANTEHTGHGYQYSALHVIGQPVFPFAHDVLHSKHRRNVVRKVIDSLKKAGCGINSLDSDGKSPLAKALENPDLQDYVLAELLEAGALVDSSITRQNENAAIIIARNSVYRRLTTSKLSIVLPLIPSINEKDNGSSSWNSLHHCAAAMSGKMTKVLLDDQRISVDERTSDGQTALHIAAAYGSSDIVDLLVGAGASLNAKNQDGRTPLEIATLRRWTDVVHVLIGLGSPVIFTGADEMPRCTVLHAATANTNDGNAIVTEVLEYNDTIRENQSLVNSQDHRGWTALHQATYYGDKKSVVSLMKAGADRSILSFNGDGSGGRTAFDIANEVLANVSADKLEPEHERIKDGGPPAVTSFRARLVEIRDILQHGL